MPLDRAAALPLHVQVHDELRALIESGEALSGERLPTELELAARYGVNRLTVRQALAELARSGLIVAKQGSGTFVADRRDPIEVELAPTDWLVEQDRGARAAAALGHTITEQLLDVDDVEARGEAAEHLGPGRLLRLETIIRYDDEAIIRCQYWSRSAWTPERVRARAEGFGTRTLVEIVGAPMYYAWRSFDAIAATHRDAAVLGVPLGSPLLLRCGLNSDAAGRPILYLERNAPSTRMRILIRHSAPPGSGR